MGNLPYQRKRTFTWCLICSCLSFGPALYAQEATTPASTPDETTASLSKGTVLRVNDDAVTSTDVIQPIYEPLQTLANQQNRREFLASASRARNLIAQSSADQVRNILMYQYAKKQLEKNENFETAIEMQMAERRKEFLALYDGSETRAREELAKYGTSIEDQLKEIERSLVIGVYQETYITPTLEVTRSAMMRYYKAHLREKYFQKPKIQFQLIDIQARKFLPDQASPNSTPQQLDKAMQEALKAAQQAQDKLHNGSDFAAVVQEYSNGYRKAYDGLWRPIDPEAIREQYQPLIQALENVPVGQTTDIIKAHERYFIAKLIDREQEKTIPFSKAQSEIDKILRSQLLAKRNKKMIDNLLKTATIGNMELFIENVHRLAWDLLKQEEKAVSG